MTIPRFQGVWSTQGPTWHVATRVVNAQVMLGEILQDIPQEESEDCRVGELNHSFVLVDRCKKNNFNASAGFVQRHPQTR